MQVILRSCIKGIKAKLKIGDVEYLLDSNTSGLLPLVEVAKLGDTIEVWVQNASKEWKKVGQAIASQGQQWMNLVSPGIKLTQELAPHDPQAVQTKGTQGRWVPVNLVCYARHLLGQSAAASPPGRGRPDAHSSQHIAHAPFALP